MDSKRDRDKHKTDPNRVVAQKLADLLGSCPHCQSGFSGHDFALLATCVVHGEKDEALLRFFQAIKDHRWTTLREFQSWLGKADNAEVYALRCSGRVTVAVVKTHLELFQGDRLLYSEALSGEEGTKLLETFANVQWHPF